MYGKFCLNSGRIIYYSAELWDTTRYIFQRILEHLSSNIVEGWIVSNTERAHIIRKMFSVRKPITIVPNSCYDYLSFVLKSTGIKSNKIRFLGIENNLRRELSQVLVFILYNKVRHAFVKSVK